MEEEVCLYQKYGFCKYKLDCQKRHFTEECKDLERCKIKQSCDKRYPKLCKKYLLEAFCKFGQECHYQHKEKDKSEEHKLKERIEELEKVVKENVAAESKMENAVRQMEIVVKAMTRKVLYLEEEIGNIKENSNKIERKEPFKDADEYENSTPVSAKLKPPGVEKKSKASKKDQFKCEKCDYACQKEATLQEHNNKKHVDQQYKVCSKKLSFTTELLYHIEKEHSCKIEDNVKNNQGQDESQIYFELCSIKCMNRKALEQHMNSNHDGHKSCDACGKKLLSTEALKNHAKNIHNESSFVFSESMLDEFL